MGSVVDCHITTTSRWSVVGEVVTWIHRLASSNVEYGDETEGKQNGLRMEVATAAVSRTKTRIGTGIGAGKTPVSETEISQQRPVGTPTPTVSWPALTSMTLDVNTTCSTSTLAPGGTTKQEEHMPCSCSSKACCSTSSCDSDCLDKRGLCGSCSEASDGSKGFQEKGQGGGKEDDDASTSKVPTGLLATLIQMTKLDGQVKPLEGGDELAVIVALLVGLAGVLIALVMMFFGTAK
jgi:hypothetical protein